MAGRRRVARGNARRAATLTERRLSGARFHPDITLRRPSRIMSVMSTTSDPRTRRPTTRTLLVTAAFGAIGAVVLIALAPVTSLLAALFPPAYAVVASVHGVLPFLGRRLLGFPWAATVIGAFVGVLSIGFTPLGVLVLVPLVLSGAAYDATLLLLARGGRSSPQGHHLIAGAVSAVVLFLISLPVMSPDDLTPWFLVLTFAGRLVGQTLAVLLSGLIARRVLRAGIMRATR